MQVSARRVRKLRVTSNHEATLASDLHHLEDAFNIASLPGLPPNGLLLIRRLNLGRIAARSSPLGIARQLDRCTLALRYQPVCVDHEEAPGAQAVWFSDPAQALFRLLARFIGQQPVDAWYWRVACPRACRATGLSEMLIHAGQELLHESARLPVTASLVMQQFTRGLDERLLAGITPQLAHSLLAEAGIYPARMERIDVSREAEQCEAPVISEHWRRLLLWSIQAWGRADVRSQWMAVNALVTRNPAALLDRDSLLFDVGTLLDRIDNPGHQTGSGAVCTDSPPADGTVCEDHVCLDPVEAGSTRPPHSQPGSEQTIVALPPAARTRPGHAATGVTDGGSVNDTAILLPASDEQRVMQTVHSHAWQGLTFWRQSGLVLLIPLLERLQIEDCLKSNPLLAAFNLPMLILSLLARRFDITEQHPLCRSVSELPRHADQEIRHFVCPAFWVQLAGKRGTQTVRLIRHRVEGGDGWCFITDPGHRLLLYTGPVAQDTLPGWHGDVTIVDSVGDKACPRLEDIERTMLLMMSRYLFRYAGMSLRSLINRSGHIAATPAHLDLVFPMKQLDISVRRAGLDINPGWVAWLGRVVQIHYQEEKHAHV